MLWLVLVGQKDTDKGDFRKTYQRRYNLIELQGPGRRQRGKAWVGALKTLAKKGRWRFRVHFEVIPGAEHRITGAFKAKAAAFLRDE